MEHAVLIERLAGLRRIVRRRLILYGVCAVLAGGVASFLAIVTIDWFIWLPPLLRLVTAVFFFAGFVAATLHWIVRPLRARLALGEIAGKLEQHFTPLRDRLSSSISFLQGGDPGSPSMVRRVVSDTAAAVQDLPLETALAMRPLAVRGAWLAVSMMVLAGTLLISPDWVRTGLYRYAYPFEAIEWPRQVSIQPLTGDLKVAMGESVSVRMKVTRGWHDALRGVVRLVETDGASHLLTMSFDADGVYTTTIDAVTRDLNYWFEAGDDNTQRRPYALRVVRRPEVIEALALIEPPSYAPSQSVRVQDLDNGPVSAPLGGAVRVSLRCSKPLATPSSGFVSGLRTEDGTLIPLLADTDDPRHAWARIEVHQNMRLLPEIWGEDGFENRGASEYVLRATPDAPPTITVLRPPALTELTPRGAVRIIARVRDDFGITSASLEAELPGGTTPLTTPLTDALRPTDTDAGYEATLEYVWRIEPLALTPGDLVFYSLVAHDNHGGDIAGGQEGRSPSLRLKIISDAEFDIRLRSDLAQLEGRVRQVVVDQAALQDRTISLAAETPDSDDEVTQQRDASGRFATEQIRLGGRVRDLARRFQELAADLEQGRTDDVETRARLSAMGEALNQTATGPMSLAGSALHQASDESDTGQRKQTWDKAVADQQDAIDRLDAMLRQMSQWGHFQGLMARTRDLLDRQQNVRTQTTDLAQEMLGKSVGALTPEEEAALKSVQRQQERIASDIDQLLESMQESLATLREKDPAGAQSVDEAIRAARAHDVARRAGGAAEAIGQNRTAAANIEQRAVAEAVRNMVAALRERQARELAQLRKQLQDAATQVAELIETQEDLRLATEEAALMNAGDDVLTGLVDQQRMLKRNTTMLGEELTAVERAVSAGSLVRQAAEPMGAAEDQLQAARPRAAGDHQTRALNLLADALAELEELDRQAEQEDLRRSLAQIRDDLQAILQAQKEVDGGVGALHDNVQARGRLDRTLTREATRLAREQASVRELIDQLLPDFDKIVVYRWALERSVRWMDQITAGLYERAIDAALVSNSKRIIREIEKLIAAIVETEALPLNKEFVEESGQGGGQGAAAAAGKPVPTVAELLVLKAIQSDIHERTIELHEGFDPAQPTEAGLQSLKDLGEDQAEVRRLTELVTQRARQP